MVQQRPMSTPIFDELLREFAGRMDEQREEPPTVPQPSQAPPATPQPAPAAAHRHRAD
ncbi:hypothetical protein [Actinocrispum sp. NPDC049592]|uniref:hypothetical protein n=1 Tax=Actinocrispum sp. NPDC049592 TaxID=3154835 RepID=UPI00342EFA19